MENNKKYPWETHSHIWKTKAAFFTYLRGNLRKAVWDTYPVKLDFKNKNVYPPPPDYKGRAKSGACCSLSGEWIPKSYLEVDHKIGSASLREWNDIMPFLEHLLLCDKNLALVSKEAHRIKSYAERMGITYEDAEVEKKYIIPFKKLKADKQKEIILKYKRNFAGDFEKILGEHLTSEKKRINIYRKLMKENK